MSRELLIGSPHGRTLEAVEKGDPDGTLVEHIPTARPRLRPEHGHLSLAVGSMGEILDDLLEAAASTGP